MSISIDDNFYSLAQVAEILRVSPAEILSLAGRQRWFRIEDIEKIGTRLEVKRQRELMTQGKAGVGTT